MRLKRSRLKRYPIRQRIIEKDKEGVPVETYGDAFSVTAEIWPAGGKIQAEVYGEKLAYMKNCRIDDPYNVVMKDGRPTYRFARGTLREQDGICVDVAEKEKPDYQIVSIRPYRKLYLELERIT